MHTSGEINVRIGCARGEINQSMGVYTAVRRFKTKARPYLILTFRVTPRLVS